MFSQILPRFLQIVSGFSPNQNFLGCTCTSSTPTFYTSGQCPHLTTSYQTSSRNIKKKKRYGN